MEMSRMYQKMRDYRKALECNELYAQNIINENPSASAYASYDKGVIYYYLGLEARAGNNEEEAVNELNTALKYLNDALESNLHMRGDLAIDTIDNQEAIADTYAALYRYSEAANAYTAALTMTEKLLGEGHPRVSAIKEKMKFRK